MAGKHTKKFFEKRSEIVIVSKEYGQKTISIPFKIIISATALALVLSLVLVGAYFVPGKTQAKLLSRAEDIFENSASYDEGLARLAADNADIKGWLKIDGADINSVVCQSENDSYYINHNQNGKRSRYGALFLSSNDTFERNGDKNIVIYGNNMKDGLMFGNLKKYRNLNFYKQNPYVSLYYEGNAENYIIFAVMLIGSFSDTENGYNLSKSYFVNEQEFDEWYSETASRSLINTTVDLEYGDEMLTLVTVADDFDGARLVVMAKKIKKWQNTKIDVSGATVNAKIKYPKMWYEKRGLEYPY